ncbi:MAG: matrixin family metalloprotease [Bdellovibrionaceae bacterium]|nr:matrixin family metalloprotease [Bdellovibrio sp.]
MGSQDSCNFVQSSQGLRVSWKSSTPFHLIITESVPPEYDSAIIQAASTWNTRKSMNLIQVHRDNAYSGASTADGINGIYWMTDWASDQSSEQARTSIRWDISKLKEADIKINAKYFRFYKTDDTVRSGKVNIESLMLHEIGHAMGLSHITTSDSAMQPYLASSTDRNSPGQIDLNSLNCEY